MTGHMTRRCASAGLTPLPSPARHLESIQRLIEAGGPTPAQYQEFREWLDVSAELLQRGEITKQQLQDVWRAQGDDFLRDTMQGFGLSKPHGYAGDFEMIDRIYQRRISSNPRHARWDHFFHAEKAPQAVRNRKAFFQTVVASLPDASAEIPAVLNLGSGPCRELAELGTLHPNRPLEIECVEQDANAITFAGALLSTYSHSLRVTFFHSNALRFRLRQRYDLVWSAGLFDYLPDRLFVALLRRLLHHLKPEGRVVVGNFSSNNPSRNYMEIVGDWSLYHRSESDLVQLALSAGAHRSNVSVLRESEGVNLFLLCDAQKEHASRLRGCPETAAAGTRVRA